MTVLENLKLGAYNTNARSKEAESLDYVLELFPRLKERMKKQAQTLSGGEARMLAIGRGLMSNAKFLAIDEPSLGLAPNLRAEVFKNRMLPRLRSTLTGSILSRMAGLSLKALKKKSSRTSTSRKCF